MQLWNNPLKIIHSAVSFFNINIRVKVLLLGNTCLAGLSSAAKRIDHITIFEINPGVDKLFFRRAIQLLREFSLLLFFKEKINQNPSHS